MTDRRVRRGRERGERGRGRTAGRKQGRDSEKERRAELADRKQRILTHGTPSVTSGIADAIVTKAENVFFLTDPSGCVPMAPGHGLGLYYHDCRFIRNVSQRNCRGASNTVFLVIQQQLAECSSRTSATRESECVRGLATHKLVFVVK